VKIPYLDAVQVLRRAGFASTEIDRLYRLHQSYRTSALDQAPLDIKRLEFARWLVKTGRLTEQIRE